MYRLEQKEERDCGPAPLYSGDEAASRGNELYSYWHTIL